MHSTYLPTAVPSLSVTSMVKGTANSLSVLRTSTWFSPSGTEYTAGSKNTLSSLSNMEERKWKYTEWHVRHVYSCVHDIWPNVAWAHSSTFPWLRCDCMWGALVPFQRNFKKCGNSALDLWRLDNPFQRANYSIEQGFTWKSWQWCLSVKAKFVIRGITMWDEGTRVVAMIVYLVC